MALIDFLLKMKKYYEINLCGMQCSIYNRLEHLGIEILFILQCKLKGCKFTKQSYATFNILIRIN